ncbi:MAG: GNAT family N-acetyltransferase [Ignavibacteria bacterium]|nr:GNAT family N-acetyltransferase [Ignavibacteria bacterium]
MLDMELIKFSEGKKIYLRPFEPEDLKLVYFGKNNVSVRETLYLYSPMTVDQVDEELQNWINNRETVLFTICQQSDNQSVGQTAFVRIDQVSRTAIFYIAIYDPNFWSKGYATESTQLMIEYGFEILNLNRIQLHVSCENDHAIKAYKKVGFLIEGTLRQAMYHNNRYSDFYVMALLREDFYKWRNSETIL